MDPRQERVRDPPRHISLAEAARAGGAMRNNVRPLRVAGGPGAAALGAPAAAPRAPPPALAPDELRAHLAMIAAGFQGPAPHLPPPPPTEAELRALANRLLAEAAARVRPRVQRDNDEDEDTITTCTFADM